MVTLRALVIDDSSTMRRLIMKTLMKANVADFLFDEAEDGIEAVHKFLTSPPDMIFCDWNMPRMNGYNFARRVRADPRYDHIPIVMITSEKVLKRIEEAFNRARVDRYITKPYTVEEVRSRVLPLVRRIEEGGKGKGGQQKKAA